MVVSALLGVGSVWTLLAFGLAAFAVGGIVRQFAVGIRAQHAGGASWCAGAGPHGAAAARGCTAGSSCTSASSRIAVALAASSAFTTKAEVRLHQGRVGDRRRLHASRTSDSELDARRPEEHR